MAEVPEVADAGPVLPSEKHLVPVARPDKELMEKTVATLNDQIKALQKKMEYAEKQIAEKVDGSKGVKTQRSAEREKMMVIRAEKQKLMDERKKIYEAKDAVQKTLDALRDASKKMRSEVKYKSVDDIDKAIVRLEHRQKTSSLPLSEEKQILKEIQNLKVARKQLDEFAKKASGSDESKDALTGLNKHLAVIMAALKEVNPRLDAQTEIVKNLESTLEAAHKDEMPELKRKKAEFKQQIDLKFNEMRKIRSDFYDQNKKFQEYNHARWKSREEQRKKEDEEWKARKAEETKKFEEEEEKKKPWLEEIATCDILITYLTGLKPKTKPAKVEETDGDEEESASSEITLADGSVLTLAPKKGVDIPIGRALKKKKQHRKKNKPANSKLVHGFDTIADFKKLSLREPLDVKDIDASLAELTAARHHYDTLPRPAKKGKKTLTPYGPGTIVNTRADGVVVVVMDWVLAEGAKVHAFMQARDLKTVTA